MDVALQAAAIYAVILLLVRVSGRRSLRELTAIDFALLLVVGEAAQLVLLGQEFSPAPALLAVAALVGAGLLLTALKDRLVADGVPEVLIEDGRNLREWMRETRTDKPAVAGAGHRLGCAAIEPGGGTAIVPK